MEVGFSLSSHRGEHLHIYYLVHMSSEAAVRSDGENSRTIAHKAFLIEVKHIQRSEFA